MDRGFRISLLDSYLEKINKCNSRSHAGGKEKERKKILRLSSWVKQKQINNNY